jgi:hypothetical protein
MGTVITSHSRIYYGVICNNIVFVVFIGNRKCINIIIVIIISYVNVKNKPAYYMKKNPDEQNAFGHSKFLTHKEKFVFSFKSSNKKGKVMTV